LKKYLIRNCELANFDTMTTTVSEILVEGDRIKKIAQKIEAPEGCEIIDAKGMLAMPSFADCHTHLAQSVLKGPMDDYPITSWLVRLFKIEDMMTPEENYYSCLLGCLTALRCGTTIVNDMAGWDMLDSVIEAVHDSKIRATIGISTTDVPENEETPILSIDEALYRSEEVYKKVHGRDGRMKASVAPAGLPAVSGRMAQELKAFANERGLVFHTHLGEGKMETNNVAKFYGLGGEAEALEQLGILDKNTLLAHSIWLSDHELDIIARTGANPVHCPCTNLKISDGIPKIAAMVQRGVNVTIGCDGEASSSNRDMIREARLAAYLQKGWTLDPTVLDAGTVYKMMTINGTRALGYDGLGELKEGNIADFILVDMDHDIALINPEFKLNNFLYAGDGKNVDTVFVGGEIVLRGGKFTFIDEEEVLAKARPVIQGLNRKILAM
jgi:5-methylthioadenosine/S-adenosylhomocysteine deaminase